MADNAPVRHRNSKVGRVVSRSGNKTIVVEVGRRVQHPLYKRFINRHKKFYAHDEKNQCEPGDRVRIIETRPLSKLKRWRLDKILYRSAIVAQEVAAREAAEKAAPEESGS